MTTLSNDEFVNQFLNTLTSGPDGPPLTASVLDDGSVAVYWQDDAVADGAIRHRMYDLEGNALQDDLVITAPTSAGPDNVVITAAAQGGFVVLWQDDTGVTYQNFDVNGNAVETFEPYVDENSNTVTPTGIYWSDLQADIFYNWSLSVEGSSVSVNGSEDARVYVWNSDYLNRTFGTSGNEAMTGSVGEDMLAGLGGNDSLSGGAGEDDLFGGSGNDVLNGGAGEDMLSGGTGNDKFVTNGSDVISENAGEGTDTVISTGSMTLGANLERLALTGSSTISGTGNSAANAITGNRAANSIDGGLGNDKLTGGAGSDNFIFSTALSANIDKITDYNVAQDTIRLENAVFTALAEGGLSASAFAANASGNAADASDRIIYETDTGKLFYDADGNGGAAKIQFATVDANLALTATDFFVF